MFRPAMFPDCLIPSLTKCPKDTTVSVLFSGCMAITQIECKWNLHIAMAVDRLLMLVHKLHRASQLGQQMGL